MTTLAVPLVSVLIGLAGIITPLGLYEDDERSGNSVAADFAYVRDSSAFFLGTSPRDDKPNTRTCYYRDCPVPCPYTDERTIFEIGGQTVSCRDIEVNATVPQTTHDIFGSGTKYSRSTVSNFFDIGWRQVTTQYDRTINNGTPVAKGFFRQLESFALTNDWRVVEGLVVDAKTGGIGFRNHTIPKGFPRGTEWSEDLLFIQPESVCVNNNVTIDFTITSNLGLNTGLSISNLTLTDRGGFAKFNKTNPAQDQRNGINKPDLRTRAYQAAWGTTALTMLYLNITVPKNVTKTGKSFEYILSNIGKHFELPLDSINTAEYQSLQMGTLGTYMGGLNTFGSSYSNLSDIGEKMYENPYNITWDEFTDISTLCEGTDIDADVRLNSTYVTCSEIRGVPRRVDDGPSTIFEDGSKWSAPIYSCASTVKATVKTVDFTHNATSEDLTNLHVKDIRDKKYNSKEDFPLWGVEDWGLPLSAFEPVWGLVDRVYEHFDHVLTIRDPALYLIGSGGDSPWLLRSLDPNRPMMNVAAAIAPLSAMQTVTKPQSLSVIEGVDTTASNSMSLWLRWRDLTNSTEKVPTLINLMWTDLASSAMVGSKGTMGNRNADARNRASIKVFPTVHRVKYDLRFAIPAFVTALVVLALALLVLISVWIGRTSISKMDHRLKQTSMGRVLTTLFYPETSSLDQTSAQWSNANAARDLSLGIVRPSSRGPQFAPPPMTGHEGVSGKTDSPASRMALIQYSGIETRGPQRYQS